MVKALLLTSTVQGWFLAPAHQRSSSWLTKKCDEHADEQTDGHIYRWSQMMQIWSLCVSLLKLVTIKYFCIWIFQNSFLLRQCFVIVLAEEKELFFGTRILLPLENKKNYFLAEEACFWQKTSVFFQKKKNCFFGTRRLLASRKGNYFFGTRSMLASTNYLSAPNIASEKKELLFATRGKFASEKRNYFSGKSSMLVFVCLFLGGGKYFLVQEASWKMKLQ